LADARASVGTLLSSATHKLGNAPGARQDVETLLAHVLEVRRTALYLAPERPLDENTSATFEQLLDAYIDGVPIAYLTGWADFWSLRLEITSAVLVPRPDTEILVASALDLIPSQTDTTVIDLGTGSGAVAAALAQERPQAFVLASDRSAAACALAQRNFKRLELPNANAIRADWMRAIAVGCGELITANPPYIGLDERPSLDSGLRHEPQDALFSGRDGLQDLRIIISAAASRLRKDGWLLVEHGYEQGRAVRELFRCHGYARIETLRDLNQHERVTRGCWPK